MQTSTASEAVVLLGGLSVPLAALQVLWAFEDRGLTIRLDHDGGLLVGPRQQLTVTDRHVIRQRRAELIALVKYCNEVVA